MKIFGPLENAQLEYTTFGSLPSATGKNTNRVFYVTDKKLIYISDGTSWNPMGAKVRLMAHRLNGEYNALTFPQTGIDGLYLVPVDCVIKELWIYNRILGASGTTEFDLQRAALGSTTFTSLLSTTGKILSTATAEAETDSGTKVPAGTGLVKPVFSSTALSAGDKLRFDIVQAMASPAADCGMLLWMEDN